MSLGVTRYSKRVSIMKVWWSKRCRQSDYIEWQALSGPSLWPCDGYFEPISIQNEWGDCVDQSEARAMTQHLAWVLQPWLRHSCTPSSCTHSQMLQIIWKQCLNIVSTFHCLGMVWNAIPTTGVDLLKFLHRYLFPQYRTSNKNEDQYFKDFLRTIQTKKGKTQMCRICYVWKASANIFIWGKLVINIFLIVPYLLTLSKCITASVNG